MKNTDVTAPRDDLYQETTTVNSVKVIPIMDWNKLWDRWNELLDKRPDARWNTVTMEEMLKRERKRERP